MSGQAVSAGRYVVAGFLAVGLLLGGLGTWAWRTTLSGAVIAQGVIDLQGPRQTLQHPLGGVVDDVLVREGTRVRVGDTLLHFDSTLAQVALDAARQQYEESEIRLGFLQHEATGTPLPSDASRTASFAPRQNRMFQTQKALFEARQASRTAHLSRLSRQRDQIAARQSGLAARERAARAALDLVRAGLANQQDLFARGLTQAAAVRALEREEAALVGELGVIDAQQAETLELRAALEAEADEVVTAAFERTVGELIEAEADLRELRLTIARLEHQIAQDRVAAPRDGVVFQLHAARKGQVLGPGETLLEIVPLPAQTVVLVQVPPGHIHRTFVGQKVALRLPGIEPHTTPQLTGVVTQVSPDRRVDPQNGLARYDLEVTLGPEVLGLLPAGTTLHPGMPAEVFLQTGDYSPLALLLKPLTDYFALALRDN